MVYPIITRRLIPALLYCRKHSFVNGGGNYIYPNDDRVQIVFLLFSQQKTANWVIVLNRIMRRWLHIHSYTRIITAIFYRYTATTTATCNVLWTMSNNSFNHRYCKKWTVVVVMARYSLSQDVCIACPLALLAPCAISFCCPCSFLKIWISWK